MKAHARNLTVTEKDRPSLDEAMAPLLEAGWRLLGVGDGEGSATAELAPSLLRYPRIRVIRG